MTTSVRLPRLLALSLTVLGLSACGSQDDAETLASADDHAHGANGEAVGSVAFPTSCSAEAQPVFEQAVAMLHSFWFDQAIATFREVAEIDPDCAMARWGEAMTLWGNPMTRAAPPADRVEEAQAALAQTRASLDRITPRERMYLEAAAALYDGYPDVGHIERMHAHEEAMRVLSEAYPDDPEAATFYGRIVVGNAPPSDLTYSRQLHAAAILEPLFQAQPDHPGLAHYLIHAFDAPATAEEGLDAALRYADIAPAAPHALHMPTHIFTRMGYWDESIELNARSAQAEPVPDAAVHPLDYMVYAYLQLGRDGEAGEIVSRAREIPDRYYGGLTGYNFAAMQARYALERDRWEDAAVTPVPVNAETYVEAVARFARALGAARSGDAGAAAPEIEALGALERRTRDAGDSYWATVIEAQRLAASAWVALVRGNQTEAVDLARRAADLEGTVEKHPVTPGPLLPARELLGDLLMEVDRPAEALAEYEATLEVERNRARALYGAARAADAAGDRERADRHFASLLELLASADEERPDLQAARDWSAR
jgi:tetratricopeptide (TPR) repeat protein